MIAETPLKFSIAEAPVAEGGGEPIAVAEAPPSPMDPEGDQLAGGVGGARGWGRLKNPIERMLRLVPPRPPCPLVPRGGAILNGMLP